MNSARTFFDSAHEENDSYTRARQKSVKSIIEKSGSLVLFYLREDYTVTDGRVVVDT